MYYRVAHLLLCTFDTRLSTGECATDDSLPRPHIRHACYPMPYCSGVWHASTATQTIAVVVLI